MCLVKFANEIIVKKKRIKRLVKIAVESVDNNMTKKDMY